MRFEVSVGGDWLSLVCRAAHMASSPSPWGIDVYPTTSGFLRWESGVKDCVDLPRQETVYLVKVGHVRAFPAVFGLPRRAIASRDAHIWRTNFQKEDNASRTLPAGSVT